MLKEQPGFSRYLDHACSRQSQQSGFGAPSLPVPSFRVLAPESSLEASSPSAAIDAIAGRPREWLKIKNRTHPAMSREHKKPATDLSVNFSILPYFPGHDYRRCQRQILRN